MKVVLFCGGLGTRLREYSDTVPKPLVNVGYQPILMHLMRYYAHYGHKDFILCLGYRGDLIRDYFLKYEEAMVNDFTLTEIGTQSRRINTFGSGIDGWKITFVDTGLQSNIGQRLLRVRRHLEGEEAFLANYADGLSDLLLDEHIEDFRRRNVVAQFISVRSQQSFHAVHAAADGTVTRLGPMPEQELWINGGFFILRHDIFRYINEGEELVEEPFGRLITEGKLATRRWHGFWQCMDTLKDKSSLDQMEARGQCPWMVWQRHPAGTAD
jgi:glucose-1-phosphate cytidylyltransferase